MVYFNAIDSGTATMQSVDGGITVTLSAGSFVAGVVAGKYVRIKSDVLAGYTAKIITRNSGTNLTLTTGIPGNLSNVDWVVIGLEPSSYGKISTDRTTSPNLPRSFGGPLQPFQCTNTPTVRTVLQRAIDLGGTANYVYWLTATPDPTPFPATTTPNFTGTLTSYEIVLDETSC